MSQDSTAEVQFPDGRDEVHLPDDPNSMMIIQCLVSVSVLSGSVSGQGLVEWVSHLAVALQPTTLVRRRRYGPTTVRLSSQSEAFEATSTRMTGTGTVFAMPGVSGLCKAAGPMTQDMDAVVAFQQLLWTGTSTGDNRHYEVLSSIPKVLSAKYWWFY